MFPTLKKAILRLSTAGKAKSFLPRALRVLKSIQISANIADTAFTRGLQSKPAIADSGELERDLADLMQTVGENAQASGKGFASLIDEPQYLSAQDYEALIVSLHRAKGAPRFFLQERSYQHFPVCPEMQNYMQRDCLLIQKLGQLLQKKPKKPCEILQS